MTTFFVKTVLGATHRVTIDPSEVDPTNVCEAIQRQLPESFRKSNFRVVCEGKDLKTFDAFPNGVGKYFSGLANIYVLGSKEAAESSGATAATPEQKIKLKLLARLHKFQDKGFTLSKYFTMESQQEEILHELALLHVLKDMQDAGDAKNEPLPVRQCIAHGCGNFLQPDEDLRCKICDY